MAEGKKEYNREHNSLTRQLDFDKMVNSFGIALLRASNHFDRTAEPGNLLRGINIKAPAHEGEDWFIVVKATIDGEFVVAFHSADSMAEVLKGACTRYVNGQLKWKRDEYVR